MPGMREEVMSVVETRNGIQCAYALRYKWFWNDAGRRHSKRPKQDNDCTVRALAIARGMEYDAAYDLLKSAGRKSHNGFFLDKWLDKQPWAHRISFPAVKGQKRMTIAQFCEEHPKGSYVIRVAKHVIAVNRGVLHDTFRNRPDRCVYVAYKVAD